MKKRIVFSPCPKTVGELRLAITGYEDGVELINPIKVYIVDTGKYKPFKMMLKHIKDIK
jgi:hypothetical protein